MFGLDYSTLALLAVGGYFVGQFLFKKDTKIEERRRAALDVVGVLQANGLNVAAEALKDYVVGDYSGALGSLKKAAVVLTNPAAATAEFDGVFEKMLTSKLADPEARSKLVARINDANKTVKPAASVS